MAAAATCLIMGVAVLQKNPSRRKNQVFALLCLSVAYWAFTESQYRQADTVEAATLWLNISAFWALPEAFLLHFALIFTKRDWLLSKWPTYLFIYVPPLAIAAIDLRTDLISAPPVKSYWGWTFEYSQTPLAHLTNYAMIALAILSVGLCLQYYLGTEHGGRRRQALLVLIGLAIPVFIGSLTDGILPAMRVRVPELATVSFAVGVAGLIGYAMWRYELFALTPAAAADEILSTMSDGLFLTDSKGKITAVNEAALRMLGHSDSEIVGRKLEAMLAPVDGADPHETMKTLSEEPVTDRETSLLTRDGTTVPVSLSRSTMKRRDGTLQGDVWLARDISDRKLVDEALRQSERKYRTLIEHSNDLIWMLDSGGRFIYANARAEEASGYNLSDWLGKSFAPMISARDLPRIRGILRAVSDGKPQHYLVTVRRDDGSRLVLSVNAAPVYESGRAGATVHFGRDITEQKRAQEALRESEERYRTLVEASPDGILVAVRGRLAYANAAAVTMLGADSVRRLMERPLPELVPTRDRLSWTQLMAPGAPETGGRPFTAVFLRLDGRPLDVELAAISTRYEDQSATQIVFRDISERKHIDQMKSDFLAMVSHELRTPLAVILGNAQVIQRLSPQDDCLAQISKSAAKIHERGEVMAGLIDSLLDTSQIQSGSFALDIDDVDVAALVRRSVESIPIGDAHVLEMRLAPDLPHLQCDPRRLSMAITNLVDNAVKFSPDGGRIVVSAQTRGEEHLCISVRDHGVGIPEEDLQRVFDRFTQSDMSATRAFSGVGMGLHIARQVCRAHGGDVSVASTVGEGSNFTIELPIARRD